MYRHMCGIVGYIGKDKALPILLDGLRRLEYRGYDSAGAVVFGASASDFQLRRAVGRVAGLESKFAGYAGNGNIGIAHTRWATHGEPSERNAHPHSDCGGRIFVCHNGIIENYKELKQALVKRGHKFKSDTDTEVLSHLIEENLRYGNNRDNGDVERKAVVNALRQVRGTYGLAVVFRSKPDKIIVARNSSPLVIGIGKDENIVASDASAIVGLTQEVIYLHDGEGAVLTIDDIKIFNISRYRDFSRNTDQPMIKKTLNAVRVSKFKEFKDFDVLRRKEKLKWSVDDAQKNGYRHFMLKEIFEQPESIKNTLRGRIMKNEGLAKLGGLEQVRDRLKSLNRLRSLNRLIITGCGTAYLAGLVGERMLEEYAGIPVEVELASELRYSKPILDRRNLAMVAAFQSEKNRPSFVSSHQRSDSTVLLAISQSGETADTLAAVRKANSEGLLTLGIVNSIGSSVSRETVAGIYNHAGPEIGVASTKAFTSQLIILALLTLFLGRQRGMSRVSGKRIAEELQKIPELIKQILRQNNKIKLLAKKYKNYDNFLYIGRKYNFPVAYEGALKLKEISYIHAEGYGAGEMKHGPIAMIDPDFPTVAIAPTDSVYEKMVSNMEEIKTRKGKILVIATEGNEKIKHIADDWLYIPKTLEMLVPILSVIPLQLFAYHMGVMRGCDVDKPRNLAKSVTVE